MRIDQSGEIVFDEDEQEDENEAEDENENENEDDSESDELFDLADPEFFQRLQSGRDAAKRDVWLDDRKMTQTEVGLRLATFLLSSRLAATPVIVTLSGYELARDDKPLFPVRRYLTERLGYSPDIA